MKRRTLADKLQQTKKLLEANEHQMAKHMRLSLANYKAIESGARVLPLPAQKTLERRMEALLARCGLEV